MFCRSWQLPPSHHHHHRCSNGPNYPAPHYYYPVIQQINGYFFQRRTKRSPFFFFIFDMLFLLLCVSMTAATKFSTSDIREREREEGADRFWLITIQTAITTRVDPPLIRRKMNDKKFDEEMTCDQPSMPRLAYLQDIVRLQSNRKYNIVAFISILFSLLN